MIYDITVIGEEVYFDPITAVDLDEAIHTTRSILGRTIVWSSGVKPFEANVIIRAIDGTACVTVPVDCAWDDRRSK